MEKRVTLDEYFRMPETNRPQELVFGILREPPTPTYGHQQAVGQLFLVLRNHVHDRRSASSVSRRSTLSLDEAAALVVEPDVIFISNERRSIIKNHIWGAPDLVVE